MALGRRELLTTGWKFGGGLLLVAAGWTAYESLRPLASEASSGPIKLGNAGRFQPGTATYVAEGRLYVTNPNGTPIALSQKCPHLGCRVPFCDSSGQFECGCHGSVFNLAGDYVGGPAPRGMTRIATFTQGNDLYADPSKTTSGPPRGSSTYKLAPKGPSCQKGG
jgi:Rieske Fe-S protein